MSKIYNGALELVGNTPLVEVKNIEEELGLEARILVKLEYFNPAGSVKDRIAKAMIEDAEEKGLLKEGSVIIEPTSGNTGIDCSSQMIPYHSYYAGDNECRKKKHPESIRSRDCSDRRRKGNEGCD